jgi:hypothetical protein
MQSPGSRILCRQILDADINNAADLLTRGFPRSNRQYWLNGLARLAKHPTPAGAPKYGYALESDGALVGIVLLITTSIPVGNTSTTRCNISSWFAEPAFRGHSHFLISRATRRPDVTYLNVSPAKHTLQTIEAQGFSRYSTGQFVSIPSLQRSTERTKVEEVGHELDTIHLDSFERELLLAHSSYGCLSLYCKTADGAYPFVFQPRIVKGIIPCLQLIYCRQITDYVRFARPLGRYLALRGRPLVIIDSNGPIPGLTGKYFEGVAPKYFRGPVRPRLGDLAYTEAAMFGL